MDELKDKYIRFDWAIKRLLRRKANFAVLEGFLTVFLGEKITIDEILESEENQETADEKFNRVDIKARDSRGDIVIIEVQNIRKLHYLERVLYGVPDAVTNHISMGETYSRVKKLYSISILYFDIGQGRDYLYYGQSRFIGAHTNDELLMNEKERSAIVPRSSAENFSEYILIRLNKFNRSAVTPLEEWMEYLKSGIVKQDTQAPGLQEARERLQYYSMTKEERLDYDHHISAVMVQNDVLATAKLEGWLEGIAECRLEGLAEGEIRGVKRTALNMKKAGVLPLSTIVECTGLTEEEIEAL